MHIQPSTLEHGRITAILNTSANVHTIATMHFCVCVCVCVCVCMRVSYGTYVFLLHAYHLTLSRYVQYSQTPCHSG